MPEPMTNTCGGKRSIVKHMGFPCDFHEKSEKYLLVILATARSFRCRFLLLIYLFTSLPFARSSIFFGSFLAEKRSRVQSSSAARATLVAT